MFKKTLKILLYTILSLLVVLTGISLYLFQFGGLEKYLNGKITELVKEKYKLDITLGKIGGSIFNNIEIEDIEINYKDSTNQYRLLRLPYLSAVYSWRNLINEKYYFTDIRLSGAEVTLVKDSSGHWVVPDFSPDDTTATDEPKEPTKIPSFSLENLNLNNFSIRLLSPGDTMKFDNFYLSLAIQNEDNTFSIDVDQFQFKSGEEKIALNAGGGQLTYDNDLLAFRDITLFVTNSRIKLNGQLLLGDTLSGEVDFSTDNIDLAKATKYIKTKLKGNIDVTGSVKFAGQQFDGSILVGGQLQFIDFQNLFVDFSFKDKILSFDTLYGTILKGCGIDGYGHIDFSTPKQTYQINASVNKFNLKDLIQNSFYSDLNGVVVLKGESFSNKDLLLDLKVDMYESYFDEYPLQYAAGHFAVTTDSITFLDDFEVHYYDNSFYVNGNVDYHKDMNLDVIAYLHDLDRYKGKLFIDQPGGRGYAEASLTGKTSDPDLKGYFVSDSLWIYGLYTDSLYSTIDIKQFLSSKQGEVTVDFFDGMAWSLPYDTGHALIKIDSNVVDFAPAYLINQYSRIDANGMYDYEAVPGILAIDTLELKLVNQTFYNMLDIIVNVDSLGFYFQQAAIGNNGSRLAISGRTNYDESMDFLLSLNEIPIKPWKNIFEDSINVDGWLSCEAKVGGTMDEPSIDLIGNVDSLTFDQLELGDLKTRLKYEDKLLSIDSVTVFSNPGRYYASGKMYMDLALTTREVERFPDRPIDIKFKASDSRFDLVTKFLPTIEEINGEFFADFTLTGTPANPHLEGEAYIRSYTDVDKNGNKRTLPASLKYFDLAQYVYTDTARVTMRNNVISIDKIKAYVMKDQVTPDDLLKGEKTDKERFYATLNGSVTVKSLDNFYYDVDVNIPKETPFTYELAEISGKAKGKLHVEGDTPPMITGDIDLTDMRYLVNFAEENEGSPIMMALTGENTWDLDIDVSIPKNYWIKNIDIDAEFAGDMKVQRVKGVYSFIGQMEILRGKGYLFDKTFRLEQGGTAVFEGGEEFNPTLDIVGYTRIPGIKQQVDGTESSELLTLGIQISGTLEEPIIGVTNDSDFGSNEDIVSLLVANTGSSQEGAYASNSFGQRATSVLASQVSQVGARELDKVGRMIGLGVETFEIDPNYSGEFDLGRSQISLGVSVFDVYVYGRSTISGSSGQEVGFEYRFNKSFMLQGLRDEDELYHLTFKFNWEFEKMGF